jgi:hypothetical protein
MTPEDKPLFLELGAVNKQINAYILALLDEVPMAAEDQHDFAVRLVELGRAIQQRSTRSPHEILDGDRVRLLPNASLAS